MAADGRCGIIPRAAERLLQCTTADPAITAPMFRMLELLDTLSPMEIYSLADRLRGMVSPSPPPSSRAFGPSWWPSLLPGRREVALPLLQSPRGFVRPAWEDEEGHRHFVTYWTE